MTLSLSACTHSLDPGTVPLVCSANNVSVSIWGVCCIGAGVVVVAVLATVAAVAVVVVTIKVAVAAGAAED